MYLVYWLLSIVGHVCQPVFGQPLYVIDSCPLAPNDFPTMLPELHFRPFHAISMSQKHAAGNAVFHVNDFEI